MQFQGVILLLFSFKGLGPPTFSDLEVSSRSTNPCRHFGRTPWTGDRPNTRPLPTHRTAQHNTKRTRTYIHPWFKRNSNSWYKYSDGPRHTHLRPCDYWSFLPV